MHCTMSERSYTALRDMGGWANPTGTYPQSMFLGFGSRWTHHFSSGVEIAGLYIRTYLPTTCSAVPLLALALPEESDHDGPRHSRCVRPAAGHHGTWYVQMYMSSLFACAIEPASAIPEVVGAGM